MPSRLTETDLSGYFERAAPIAGKPLVGLRFIAKQEMTGSLPDHPGETVTGTVTLTGNAYYSPRTGILDRIESRLSFDGQLQDGDTTMPVHMTYARIIRAIALLVASNLESR